MNNVRNDFQYPYRLRDVFDPIMRRLKGALVHEVEQVIALLTERDRALEDMLGAYRDLDMGKMQVLQGNGSATIDQANSIVRGRRLGRSAHVYGSLTFSASTCEAGSAVVVALPDDWERRLALIASPFMVGGEMAIGDTGTTNYEGSAFPVNDARSWGMLTHNVGSLAGINPSFALAVGDHIWFNIQYELARAS